MALELLGYLKDIKITQALLVQDKASYVYLNTSIHVEFRAIFEGFLYILLHVS